MMKSIIFGAALVACAVGEGPSLAVLKEMDTEDLVEGRNCTIFVQIFNVGDAAAYNVELEDAGYSNLASMPKRVFWDSIAPGANVETQYTIVPLKSGQAVQSKPAQVTFRLESGSVDVKVSFSNVLHDTSSSETIEGMPVLSQAAFEKKTSRRTKEWLAFILLLVIPLGMPFFFFQTSTNSLKQKRAVAKKEAAAASIKRPSSPVRRSSPVTSRK
ncbi:Translocon-associated protein subunit beta [Diplonema papillatum]|nr:Translocon-associated protein subunit beta [Diplonema papillatum]